jgi:predicted RNA binding protein YcfA (HicA-like mRNA interferase family)
MFRRLFFALYILFDISLMNGKQVIKFLEASHFRVLRTRGSHYILSDGLRKVTVPVHGSADLKIATLKSIEKQSGVKLT